jgi:tRNA(Ile)-lysidine synthase
MVSRHQEHQSVVRMHEALRRALRRLGLVGRGVLAAVSGGADSLVLMHGLASVGPSLGLAVEVATVDHGLQVASGRWADGVAAAAASLGLRCHRIGLPALPGGNLEAAARQARYAALEQIRGASGLDVVATAHTASDQAETVLMRLVRGAALGGGGGIRERRQDRVVRPLLFATRADVDDYVAAVGLTPVQDPMNHDRSLLRTRVRNGAIPALADAAGFDVQPALARFAGFAREDHELLWREAEVAHGRCTLGDGALDRVSVQALPRPIRRRVLVRLLDEAGVSPDAELVEDALLAIAAGGTATLPGDALLTCANDRVSVVAAPPRKKT